MPKKTTEQFIKEAQELHKDESGNPIYLYNKSLYTTKEEKLIIICKSHGEFLQSPNHHLSNKRGCPECAMEIKKQQGEGLRSSTQNFIEKAIKIHFDESGPLYNYDEVNYVNAKTKVSIKCRQNHSFLIAPTNHLQGSGCAQCYQNNRGKK